MISPVQHSQSMSFVFRFVVQSSAAAAAAVAAGGSMIEGHVRQGNHHPHSSAAMGSGYNFAVLTHTQLHTVTHA